MTNVIAGPCGSGKTTVAKELPSFIEIDKVMAKCYPLFSSVKPWRYHADHNMGNPVEAELWEELQVKSIVNLVNDGNSVICHDGALWRALDQIKEPGTLFLLAPHPTESMIQRQFDPILISITKLSQKGYNHHHDDLAHKAIKLGWHVISMPQTMNEQRTIAVIKDLIE